MDIFLLLLRIFLAVIFFIAAVGKLFDLEGSEKANKAFGVPESLAKPLAILLPILEISVAILLLFIGTSWFGAIGGTLLFTIFIGGMLWQLKQGNAPDCHCFGQIHSEPVSSKSILRNAAFLVLSLALVFSGRQNQGLALSGSADVMQIIFGLIIVGILIVAILYLSIIKQQQTEILRRLDILEMYGGEGGGQERENVGNPSEGLPIGAPLPNFIMPTAEGAVIKLEQILLKRKPMLFINVSPSCKPCEALLPEIEVWEKELSEQIEFVFITRGSKNENLEKFGSDISRTILIQDDNELADLMEIRWTPTALFANKNGVVASHPAAGDAAIRELIEQIKSENIADDLAFVAKENANGKAPKIGETIPEFKLKDIGGQEVETNDLKGKKTLVAFWSLSCPHCKEMIGELRDWDKIKGQDEPNLVVFSDGDLEDHENLNLNSPVVIDEDYKIADKLGMFGTPSAVLVNESGKIVSETAIGAGQIWALLGRRK